MPILYKDAKQILAQYAKRGGSCPTDEGIDLFVRQVLQYMLHNGQYGNLRKFTFKAVKGCITAPYELEVPLKVKIDGEIAGTWDKWFEWHQGCELERCVPAAEALFEDPNETPIAYEVPAPGMNIGALAFCKEDCDTRIIIKGIDPTGREVITVHDGQQQVGEVLTLQQNVVKYTNVVFAKVTSVIKDKTNGHVQLYGVVPGTNTKVFLSEYTPFEQKPMYRRFRLTSPNCGPYVKVSIIGRIRLKEYYADTDYIPFENLYAISIAGQAVNSQYNNDVQTAAAKDQALQTITSRENEYKRINNGQPLSFAAVTSAGRIRNII